MCIFFFHIHLEGIFILGASSIPDPLLQEAHLTPTAPREGEQSPDRTNRDLNQVHPGEGQGLNPLPGKGRDLAVQDTAVAANISPGHTLPEPGETGTVYMHYAEV